MGKRVCRWAASGMIGGVLALAGCGGGASTGAATVPVTATPAPSPTPATVGGLTIQSAAYLAIDLTSLANYAQPVLPAYYDAQVAALDNTSAANPVTNAGATLGRVLFNDKRLSVSGTISCASCHQQALGFTDSAQFSVGFSGNAFTTAHAMRLGNIRYYQPGTMFWNRRTASVEAQASVPIQNAIEMGFDSTHGGLAALTTAMNALPYYPELFTFVYGDPAITETRIQNALAQFERSMITTGSRWDAGYATAYNPQAPAKNLDVDLPNLTTVENRGRHLFIAGPGQGGVGCAGCHVPPTFALDGNAKSNGLDAGETTIFKSPSLKNGSRGPFMHDGRFATLAQVVDHYDSGVLDGPALDQRLKPGGVPQQLHLSAADKAALVAFLATLDDPGFFTDARFVSPFKK